MHKFNMTAVYAFIALLGAGLFVYFLIRWLSEDRSSEGLLPIIVVFSLSGFILVISWAIWVNFRNRDN